MPVDYEPEPRVFHVVLHFKEEPSYFSTYVTAFLFKYAIELASAQLSDYAKRREVSSIKPLHASVGDGQTVQHYVNRAGEWLELETWRTLRAARKRHEKPSAEGYEGTSSASP